MIGQEMERPSQVAHLPGSLAMDMVYIHVVFTKHAFKCFDVPEAHDIPSVKDLIGTFVKYDQQPWHRRITQD